MKTKKNASGSKNNAPFLKQLGIAAFLMAAIGVLGGVDFLGSSSITGYAALDEKPRVDPGYNTVIFSDKGATSYSFEVNDPEQATYCTYYVTDANGRSGPERWRACDGSIYFLVGSLDKSGVCTAKGERACTVVAIAWDFSDNDALFNRAFNSDDPDIRTDAKARARELGLSSSQTVHFDVGPGTRFGEHSGGSVKTDDFSVMIRDPNPDDPLARGFWGKKHAFNVAESNINNPLKCIYNVKDYSDGKTTGWLERPCGASITISVGYTHGNKDMCAGFNAKCEIDAISQVEAEDPVTGGSYPVTISRAVTSYTVNAVEPVSGPTPMPTPGPTPDPSPSTSLTCSKMTVESVSGRVVAKCA